MITDGFRFRIGVFLVLGLIWTSAAVGGDPLFAPAVHYAAGDTPSSVAIGDLDGDQVPDLAVANEGQYFSNGTVAVFLGIGDGTFADRVLYAAGVASYSVAIGDLNGDQVPDLTVANGTSNDVSVLLGVGDGTFAAAVNYPAGIGCYSVAIGDLNGDQVPDLATADSRTVPYNGNVSVLLGVGDGTFAAAMHYAAHFTPVSIAIGDLNGDQVPDLAVANTGSNNVSVLLGLGDGTFAAPVHYAAGNEPWSAVIGDLNGDQVPDLAVANRDYPPGVSVLLGIGDGAFAPAVHYPAGIHPWSVAIGDLDGDQVPDLAVANWGAGESDNVLVLPGVGDGTFAAAVHFGAGLRPKSIAIGDLNGDQAPDLAVANIGSDNVSVLLNQSGDCNGNGIPDECDIDCGPPGGPCDVPGCGQSQDCNGNGVPDECELCGDLDDDGDVDGDDYAILLAALGHSIGDEGYDGCADLDGDGTVTLVDYQLWLLCYRDFIGDPFAGPPLPGDLGDMDGDDDVDLDDFALFAGRMGGPGATTPPPGCNPADFEGADLEGDDGDVDLSDFALFVRQFSGSQ